MKNLYLKVYDIKYGSDCEGMNLPHVLYTEDDFNVSATELCENVECFISEVTDVTCESYQLERMTLTTSLFSSTFKDLCILLLKLNDCRQFRELAEDATQILKDFDAAWSSWPGRKSEVTSEAVDAFANVLDAVDGLRPRDQDDKELVRLAFQVLHMTDDEEAVWTNTTPITYRDLLTTLLSMSETELDSNVTIQDDDEFFSASGYTMTEDNEHSDVIEKGTYVLTINK